MNRARRSIDNALLSMKLNVTRNMSQESVIPALSIKQDVRGGADKNRSNGTAANRTISGRTTPALVNGNLINLI